MLKPDILRWAHQYVDRCQRPLFKPERLANATLDAVAYVRAPRYA